MTAIESFFKKRRNDQYIFTRTAIISSIISTKPHWTIISIFKSDSHLLHFIEEATTKVSYKKIILRLLREFM